MPRQIKKNPTQRKDSGGEALLEAAEEAKEEQLERPERLQAEVEPVPRQRRAVRLKPDLPPLTPYYRG